MEEQLTLTISPRPKRLDEYGEVLTVEEAAKVLRISRSSAYELARRWRSDNPTGLPVIQLGRFLRVPRSALEEMLARPAEFYLTPDDRG
jgi:excisionase family DNA binding protein